MDIVLEGKTNIYTDIIQSWFRKVQSWFRRKVDNAFVKKQDLARTRPEVPASNEKALGDMTASTCSRIGATATEIISSSNVQHPLLSPVPMPGEAVNDWIAEEPRRPPSAYFFFVKSRCREFEESSGDYSKQLGTEWSALSAEELALWSHSAGQLEESFKPIVLSGQRK